jgi:hypothetical protein
LALGVVAMLASGIFPMAAVAASSGVIADRYPTSNSFDEAARIDKAKQTLLSLAYRPTVTEFLEIMGELPVANPFQALGQDARVEKIGSTGPELIAALEYAYPGVIWAILGRDSALTGDVLEAFYIQNGISNRVVRLNASTDSFATPDMELKFLYSAGLLPAPEAKTQKRWVILDPTSWSVDDSGRPLSQIRKLIAAYYRRHAAAGELRKVGAIGLGTSGRGNIKGTEIVPRLDVERFLAGARIAFQPGPEQILYTSGDLAYLQIDPKDSTEVAWHEKFQAFRPAHDGRIVAEPGKQHSERHKEHILYMMFETVRTIRKPQFFERVTQASRRYGYEMNRALRADLDLFDQPERFAELLKQHWTKDSIHAWRENAFKSLPRSLKGLSLVASVQLAAAGYRDGGVSQAQFEKFVREAIDHAANSTELTEFLAGIIADKISSDGSGEIKNVLLKEDWIKPKPSLNAIVRVLAEMGMTTKLASIDMMNEMKGRTTTILDAMAVTRAGLNLVRTADDFLKLTEFGVLVPSDEYREAMSAFIAKNINVAIEAGATIDTIHKLKKRMYEVNHIMTLMEQAFKLVKSQSDFKRLTRLGTMMPSDFYKEKMRQFIARHEAEVQRMDQQRLALDSGQKLSLWHRFQRTAVAQAMGLGRKVQDEDTSRSALEPTSDSVQNDAKNSKTTSELSPSGATPRTCSRALLRAPVSE